MLVYFMSSVRRFCSFLIDDGTVSRNVDPKPRYFSLKDL